MGRVIIAATAAAIAFGSSPAFAAPKELIHPLQLSNETIRFDRGEFTVDQTGLRGAVQITPEVADRSNLSFTVAIFNGGDRPINVDVSNIRVEGTDAPVRVLTRHDMVQKAENRAGWAKALTVIGGALVAGSMASQQNYYTATTHTPFGTYYSHVSAPCGACQVAAVMTAARTDYKIERIHGALDAARQSYGREMLQLTTLDPGRTYGGRIYLAKFKRKPMSEMRLIVRINDEDYVFGFRFAKPGTPPPSFRLTALPAPPMPVSAVPATRVDAPPVQQNLVHLRYASAVVPPPVPQTYTALPPRSVASQKPGARSDAWHRYYEGLRSTGMGETKARAQADREIGAGL